MQLPRLKEWRESRGLLQKELASEAGLSEFTINRIETGDNIRPNTARKVADALGVEVADLIESPPVPLAGAPQESGLLDKATLRRLPPSAVTILRRLLQARKDRTGVYWDIPD